VEFHCFWQHWKEKDSFFSAGRESFLLWDDVTKNFVVKGTKNGYLLYKYFFSKCKLWCTPYSIESISDVHESTMLSSLIQEIRARKGLAVTSIVHLGYRRPSAIDHDRGCLAGPIDHGSWGTQLVCRGKFLCTFSICGHVSFNNMYVRIPAKWYQRSPPHCSPWRTHRGSPGRTPCLGATERFSKPWQEGQGRSLFQASRRWLRVQEDVHEEVNELIDVFNYFLC